ncbi:hypothetical protein GW17_00012387 [Ensete ventricosum]|nr:hypothetical protein GW17_00012387 [Ensete ventricosum]
MSDNSSHIEVLAMLIEKVRERIRTKTLVNLQRSGFFPERWRHNLLDSVAITLAHHSPLGSCHAQFLCSHTHLWLETRYPIKVGKHYSTDSGGPRTDNMADRYVPPDVGEWIQVVISCFPLRTTLETGNSIVDLLRHASDNESSLLLSLFRKQLYCYDASAAIDQKSPISSSSGDLVSSLSVQIHQAKLTAVSVGYCWQEFVEDDWNYVLDKSHRWLESSVLLMEEIAESIDDAIVHYTTTDDLEHTAKKLELSVQAHDSLIISISTTALVIFRLVSQLEEHKTDSTNALHLLRLGKWADMKDRIMASILRLFFATGATEAIAMSCNEVFSTIVASSRLPYSYFWGLVASFVSNSPKHVTSAAAESMELWGLSKGPINALYAILFSSRPISYLQFAAYSLLSSDPICRLSLAKESSLEGEGLPFRSYHPVWAKMRRRLVFLRWDEALPRSSAGRRGGTSSSCAVLRRRLVLPLEDASSSFVGTRRCLVLLLEGEAAPRLPALGRGAASFLRWKMRRRLVFQRWDEVLPRSPVGR